MAASLRNRASAIALTFSMVAVALAVAAPAAEAGHCAPHVFLAAPHNSGNWVSNSYPYWSWYANGCNVVHYGVSTSWGGYFETGGTAYQPGLGDGAYYIAVRTLAYYQDYHCSWWWCGWETHYYWTGWTYSQTAYIDRTAPTISHSIGQPKLTESGTTFLTSDTPITVSASDALSGVASLQWNLDGGSWNSFTGAFNVVGPDGSHNVGYRATDRAGNVRAASFSVVLDNTAPVMDVQHPTPNSANVNEFSLETCTDTIRLTESGETVAEFPPTLPAPPAELPPAPPMPELPELPEAPAAPPTPETPPLPAELPEAPTAPEAPEVIASGPEACAGQVIETNELTVTFPAIPPEVPTLPPLPVTPPAAPPMPPMPPLPPLPPAPALPPTPALPATPELPPAPESPVPLPEVPAVPEGASVDAQNVDFTPAIVVSGVTTFTVDVDDAIVGTKLVEFIVDGEVLDAQSGGDGTFTFTFDANGYSAGEHEFSIRATDRLGNDGTLTFTVIVVPQTQAGVEATAAEAQAEAEAAAAQAQADAEAKIEELQNTQPPTPPALPALPVPLPPLP